MVCVWSPVGAHCTFCTSKVVNTNMRVAAYHRHDKRLYIYVTEDSYMVYSWLFSDAALTEVPVHRNGLQRDSFSPVHATCSIRIFVT